MDFHFHFSPPSLLGLWGLLSFWLTNYGAFFSFVFINFRVILILMRCFILQNVIGKGCWGCKLIAKEHSIFINLQLSLTMVPLLTGLQASDPWFPTSLMRLTLFSWLVCCELGAGTKKDPLKSITWYKKASALGDTAAMYKLGTYADMPECRKPLRHFPGIIVMETNGYFPQ